MRVKIPEQLKDLNDWTRAGATPADLRAAMVEAAKAAAIKGEKCAAELALVLDSICEFLRRHVVFTSPTQPIVIALWITHTWILDAFDCTPYLHVSSPEKRSGKTKLLDCLELIAAKVWRAISPSEAVLYRKIEIDHPTLLLDEVDTVFSGGNKDERKEPLRALLNAGFERKAKVPRCIGQGSNYHVQEFSVFCAKAFAGIGKLPDTIADRCIPIRLNRRSREEKIERFRKRDAEAATFSIRESLAAWAQENGQAERLRAARPEIPCELDDRQADICEPLLAIADQAGGSWSQRCREALVALYAIDHEDEESLRVKLLSDIREAFEAAKADRLGTEQLLGLLVNRESDAPWADWWEHHLSNGNTRGPAAKLARLLKPFGIRSRGSDWVTAQRREATCGKTLRRHGNATARLAPPENARTQQIRSSTCEKQPIFPALKMQHQQSVLHPPKGAIFLRATSCCCIVASFLASRAESDRAKTNAASI